MRRGIGGCTMSICDSIHSATYRGRETGTAIVAIGLIPTIWTNLSTPQSQNGKGSEMVRELRFIAGLPFGFFAELFARLAIYVSGNQIDVDFNYIGERS